MKPKFLPVLEMAIADGISAGWYRAHKHTDTPDEGMIKQAMEEEVWNQLYEWFDFPEPEEPTFSLTSKQVVL